MRNQGWHTKKLLRVSKVKIATEIPLEERKKILFSVFDILLSQNQNPKTYDKKNEKDIPTKKSSDFLFPKLRGLFIRKNYGDDYLDLLL